MKFINTFMKVKKATKCVQNLRNKTQMKKDISKAIRHRRDDNITMNI
jgi:hypothetical protein